MFNGGGDIAFNEQVISGLNGDGLWNPPVVRCEGELGSSGSAIDGDLITAGDGEGDVVGGSGAKNGAIDDGGAGIFCEACFELVLFEEKEFVAECWVGVDAGQNGGGMQLNSILLLMLIHLENHTQYMVKPHTA